MKTLFDSLKKNKSAIIVWGVTLSICLIVFLLYDISLEPFLYSAVISSVITILCIAIDFFSELKNKAEREQAKKTIPSAPVSLPAPSTLAEADYQQMIEALECELQRVKTEFNEANNESVDYYSAWVHQIKTPIAVMKLKLSDDTPENGALLSELFRIEQYVEMVLQYVRLGSASTDLVIKEYQLDEIVKESIKKYASQFIEKKLKLCYEPINSVVVTDIKWLGCVIDQLISNALKYTSNGRITIYYTDNTLHVADTGIGIPADDIPRIFEKGYTGCNGRIGEKSSGLGLYLAKKAADLINVRLSVDSVLSHGTTFKITFIQ